MLPWLLLDPRAVHKWRPWQSCLYFHRDLAFHPRAHHGFSTSPSTDLTWPDRMPVWQACTQSAGSCPSPTPVWTPHRLALWPLSRYTPQASQTALCIGPALTLLLKLMLSLPASSCSSSCLTPPCSQNFNAVPARCAYRPCHAVLRAQQLLIRHGCTGTAAAASDGWAVTGASRHPPADCHCATSDQYVLIIAMPGSTAPHSCTLPVIEPLQAPSLRRPGPPAVAVDGRWPQTGPADAPPACSCTPGT